MIITRQFRDPLGHAAAGATPVARTALAHWRNDNAVLLASTRQIEFPPVVSPLSIKSVTRGAIAFTVLGRRLLADDDHFLVINSGDVYSSAARAATPFTAFSVYFRPGLHEEVAAGLRQSAHAMLDAGSDSPRALVEFSRHLRHHDDHVSPALAAIRAQVLAGRTEADWYEEAFSDLLVRLIDADCSHRRLADLLGSARRSTREELLRRINLAADFINSNYRDPITLDDMARAALLSKFHLARLFRAATGLTPHSYLQRKRTRVARRLLDTSDLDIGEIVAASGFGSRWTMYRFLRKSFGAGGRTLRRADLPGRGAVRPV